MASSLSTFDQIKPIPVEFGIDGNAELQRYVEDNIIRLNAAFQTYWSEKLPEQRRIYKGEPLTETKSFPWENASNIVVQIAGQAVDNLQARIMSSIYEVYPIFPLQLLGNWDASEDAEGLREAFEEFLGDMALSPDELNFYKIESLWLADVLKHGWGVAKEPYCVNIEQQYVNIGGVPKMMPKAQYIGPKLEKVLLDDFAVEMTANSLADARFKFHKIRYSKFELLEKVEQGAYAGDVVDEILKSPDRHGPSPEKVQEYERQGLNTSLLYVSGEWDIYECWFPYWKDGKKFRIIYTYHLGAKKELRKIFNFYPDNEEPFIESRLGYTDDGIMGRGVCTMLEDYQEEVTTNHNQRADNRTIANCSIIRVDPNTRLDSQFRFYPNLVIPGKKDEIEALRLGAIYPSSVDEEMLAIKLSEDRIGVGASTASSGGLGSGTVGKTTGAYSSMGTMSVMQDQNKRIGANIMDFKHAHMRAGAKTAKMYGYFGTAGKENKFGNNAPKIMAALEAFMSGRMGFNVKSTNASINREVEKQNLLLLTQVMQKHYTAIGQVLQAASSGQLNPVLVDYLLKTIVGANELMKRVLIAFNVDDKSRILPKTQIEEQANEQQSGGAIPGAATQTPGTERPIT